jgi:glycosyltransferase involved in cell wall biosynthesis
MGVGDYSVVVPTKDRHDVIGTALESVAAQTAPARRVVVVDAGDRPWEPPADLRRRLGDALVVIRRPPSTSAQRNAGLDLVETPLVLFMDDDVELPPDYVATLLDRWEAEGGLEAVAAATGGPANPPPPESPLGQLYRRVFQLHVEDRTIAANRFRLSGKLRYRYRPDGVVRLPAVSTMASLYRTDLVRRHRFDEHFDGYALGEDIDLAARVARDGPLLHVPGTEYRHHWAPGDRGSPRRWWYRGRCDTWFRLKRLDRTPLAVGAFALSVVGELIGAAADSVRERTPSHAVLFVRGLAATLRDLPPRER